MFELLEESFDRHWLINILQADKIWTFSCCSLLLAGWNEASSIF
jgi:hypothetical protein